MEMNLCFPSPVSSSGKAVFAMLKNGRLIRDVDAQRAAMVDYLDSLNYMNGNSFDDPTQTRHAITYLGFAIASMAAIDPFKTREALYNLGIIVDNLGNDHLTVRVDPYNSDNVRMVERGLMAALYRLVSGRPEHDDVFHEAAGRIFEAVRSNRHTQHVAGIDTTNGRFDIVPNAMALMVLELHDRLFGTRFSAVRNDVLDLLLGALRDSQTGLFFESYQTGYIGYPGESVNSLAAWHTTSLLPGVNALAIAFLNHFDPHACSGAWEAFKDAFMAELLSVTADDMAESVGRSFVTQLGPSAEGLLGGMLAAREMGDEEAYDALEKHLFKIGQPHLWEGHLFFTEFGDFEHMIGHFAFFARAHVGWSALFERSWENYYDFDFREIR